MVSDEIDWNTLDAAQFYAMLSTEEKAFSLADRLGLLHQELFCRCGAIMDRQVCSRAKFKLQFVCTKSRSVCGKTKSVLECSWFSNSRLSMQQAFFAICSYAAEMTCDQLAFFAGMKSSKTIVDWRSFFRDICSCVLNERNESRIGGEGYTVEIDETLIFKRKSQTGRLLANESSGTWVFGGICRENSEAFLVKVANRNAATLLQAIQENILPGTRIISDCWRAYSIISQSGYSHATINHSYNFVDPLDASVNTQRVERMWRTLKSIIPKASSEETRWSYLAEFIFKQRTNWYSISIGSRVKLIIDHVQAINFTQS